MVEKEINVTIRPVPTSNMLELSPTSPLKIWENTAAKITIKKAELMDTDNSETLHLIITDLSNSVKTIQYRNTTLIPNSVYNGISYTIASPVSNSSLIIEHKTHFSGSISLKLQAVSVEKENLQQKAEYQYYTIEVLPQVYAPILEVHDVYSKVGEWQFLNISNVSISSYDHKNNTNVKLYIAPQVVKDTIELKNEIGILNSTAYENYTNGYWVQDLNHVYIKASEGGSFFFDIIAVAIDSQSQMETKFKSNFTLHTEHILPSSSVHIISPSTSNENDRGKIEIITHVPTNNTKDLKYVLFHIEYNTLHIQNITKLWNSSVYPLLPVFQCKHGIQFIL